jgi:ribosomal protein L31
VTRHAALNDDRSEIETVAENRVRVDVAGECHPQFVGAEVAGAEFVGELREVDNGGRTVEIDTAYRRSEKSTPSELARR